MGDNPFPWTAEIEAEMLDRIAKGQSVVDICSDDWLPSQGTFYKRLREDSEFLQRYSRAREMQADTLFDQVLQIADDGRNDWMERRGEDAVGYVENGEALRRSELRVKARQWMAARLRPKVYGEKLELSGDPERPLAISAAPLSPQQWAAQHADDSAT